MSFAIGHNHEQNNYAQNHLALWSDNIQVDDIKKLMKKDWRRT